MGGGLQHAAKSNLVHGEHNRGTATVTVLRPSAPVFVPCIHTGVVICENMQGLLNTWLRDIYKQRRINDGEILIVVKQPSTPGARRSGGQLAVGVGTGGTKPRQIVS